MRYAVMSDVHANPKALEFALADARHRECERFILLGDITGYGYNVKDTLQLVRENFDVVLMGNHDSACLGLEPKFEVQTNRNYRVDLKHREQLSEEEVDWLLARPYEHTEGDALFVHGDSTDPRAWNYILTSEMVAVNLLACPKPILFCGHSHHAAIWELVEGPAFSARNLDIRCGPRLLRSLARPVKDKVDEHSLRLNERGRYIVNVGSVGYPRNDLCCTYAIYDTAERKISIRRFPIKLKSYAADLAAAGIELPYWLVEELSPK
jgi:predicted phosphodiesterase